MLKITGIIGIVHIINTMNMTSMISVINVISTMVVAQRRSLRITRSSKLQRQPASHKQ